MLLKSSSSSQMLLSNPKPKCKLKPITIVVIIIVLLIVTSLCYYYYYYNNLFSSPPKLSHPTLLLLSFDGFRFGYQHKTPTPNLHRLISGGTSAALGLIPVFPSLTFPNHYSIATGLYPPHHGIVNNVGSFSDPATGNLITRANYLDPSWWLGEPIWETAANHGLTAASYFWAGSEVPKGNWTCPPRFCFKYNQSVPFEHRVDAVLSFFDDPNHDHVIPEFTALYFSDPDSQGHRFGPDHPEITAAVAHADEIIGRLVNGLETRGILDEVHIIVVGDHGMVGTCRSRYVFVEDLKLGIPDAWVESRGQLLAVRPPEGVSAAQLVERMNAGLESGEVKNGDRLKVYLKGDLPERLHYSDSDRIAPIIGLVEEGYTVEASRSQTGGCGGAHGYDNSLFSMRSIFVGHGPRFAKGKMIPSFENVEIYSLMTDILQLKGAPNDGSDSFAKSVLLPS